MDEEEGQQQADDTADEEDPAMAQRALAGSHGGERAQPPHRRDRIGGPVRRGRVEHGAQLRDETLRVGHPRSPGTGEQPLPALPVAVTGRQVCPQQAVAGECPERRKVLPRNGSLWRRGFSTGVHEGDADEDDAAVRVEDAALRRDVAR